MSNYWKPQITLALIKGIWQYKGNVLSCHSPFDFVVFNVLGKETHLTPKVELWNSKEGRSGSNEEKWKFTVI